MTGSLREVRAEVAAVLTEDRNCIELALRDRIDALSSCGERRDTEFMESRWSAIRALITHSCQVVKMGDSRIPDIPLEIHTQARLAARKKIALDALTRRCLSAHAVLDDFILSAARRDSSVITTHVQQLLREQAILFDHLIRIITAAYENERSTALDSNEKRRAARIGRLLEGEQLDTSEYIYSFAGWHVGLVAEGSSARTGMLALVGSMDLRHIIVQPSDNSVWVWIGGIRPIGHEILRRQLESLSVGDASVAVGQRAKGTRGWRLTHQQAKAALPIARSQTGRLTHYDDVALLAAMRADVLLHESLRRRYVEPLEGLRDGGEATRQTLRAYISSGQNTASAAASLSISRRAVSYRLRSAEDLFGRPIANAAAEIEAALRYSELFPT